YMPRTKVPAVPGEDLRLYLDLDLQEWIAKIFPEGMRGAVVAIEPKTGHGLAMYSSPGFDPSALVGGADPAHRPELNTEQGSPRSCRAAAGMYPLGSE